MSTHAGTTTRCLTMALLIGAAAGCDDSGAAPPAPSGGGEEGGLSAPFPGSASSDDGDDRLPDSEIDGGSDPRPDPETPLPEECIDVSATSAENDARTPQDFEVTRAFATWEGGCDAPVLVIGLSEGPCPGGAAHELEIRTDALDIRDGVIRPNTPIVLRAEPAERAPRVRYRRPEGRMPSGTWGTCAGVGGTITFGLLAGRAGDTLRRDETLRGAFAFELTDCTGDSTQGVIAVDGSFDVPLARGFEDVCP